MGAVKSATDLIECMYCGQLIMFDSMVVVSVADSPDDYENQEMCPECAQGYEKMCQDEPPIEEEEECIEKIP